jgi:hypothetical protein
MRTRGLVKTLLAAGLSVVICSEGANAIPLAGGMRGQNVTKISNDRGGYVIQYAMRLQKLKQAGTSVQFAGPCLSACTLYLALPTSQTCISRRASFSFHAAYGAGPRGNAIATSYMFNKYPGWVRSWISSKGGLSRRLITMPYGYASKYMKPCETATAIAEKTPRAFPKRGFKALRAKPPRQNFAKAASI